MTTMTNNGVKPVSTQQILSVYSKHSPKDVLELARKAAIETPTNSLRMPITPEIAKYILDQQADFQRNVSERSVRDLATEIKKGNWEVTPQGLSLTDSFQVVDGQHRLHAILKANMVVDAYVFFDVDPRLFRVFDRGRIRTGSQIASMGGVEFNASYHIAAVNSLLWNFDTANSVAYTWSLSELEDVLEYFAPQLAFAFPAGCSRTDNLRYASIRGALLRVLIAQPQAADKLEDYVRVVAQGLPLDGMSSEAVTMPLMNRNLAFKAVKKGLTKSTKHHLWKVSLNCIKHYLEGTVIKSEISAARAVMKQPFPIWLDEKDNNMSFRDFVESKLPQ